MKYIDFVQKFHSIKFYQFLVNCEEIFYPDEEFE